MTDSTVAFGSCIIFLIDIFRSAGVLVNGFDFISYGRFSGISCGFLVQFGMIYCIQKDPADERFEIFERVNSGSFQIAPKTMTFAICSQGTI